ncbi:hypothetical protein LTR85_008572 [Meristemomyces frigidus]|nr:hypothetical protein LTR85_008572 [Meristemomyces frigidus]
MAHHLKGVFINIVDFVQAIVTKKQVQTFASAKALRNYIHVSGKIFRLRIATKDPLLKELLIRVF